MVVETSRSYSRSQKPTMIFSSWCSSARPCATAMRASGTSSLSLAATRLIEATRLCTKKIWPSRISSRRMAAPICFSSYGPTNVRIGCRSSGGVRIVDISRMPVRPISSVRGIGVADMASTSTWVRRCFMASLCSTPKRCSSSMMIRPRSLKRTSGLNSRWVPMTTSTEPARMPSSVSLTSPSLWKREIGLIVMGKLEKRSAKVDMCCCTSRVVGTSTATCLPSWTALKAARTAISVLP